MASLSKISGNLLVRFRSLKRPISPNYFVLLIIPLAVPIGIFETYLRIEGGLDTYAERTGNSYRSYFNLEPSELHWSYKKNTTLLINQKEFTYEYVTNELGLREATGLISNPDTAAFRILTLGDSFTEGFGAPVDSSWPRALEALLNNQIQSSQKVQVYNAGMAGSDPFFNYRMLVEELLVYEPHLIIQTVNSSDLADYLFRGGLERFRESKVVFRKGPWWELLYRFSYVFRLLVHGLFDYNFMLVTENTRSAEYDMAISEYYNLFRSRYSYLSETLGIQIVYLFLPMPSDLIEISEEYHHLLRLDSLLHNGSYNSIDLRPSLINEIAIDSAQCISWPIDEHYNSTGYWKIGGAVHKEIVHLVRQHP